MSQTNQTNNIAYIYNPANYSEEELIKNFIVRLDEFNSIFKVIKKDDMKHPPQHFIIQGLRGNGKTTLLQRLYYEVKNDTELNKKLIPVIFDEEEYGIRKLYRLWERIAENVEDNYPEFNGIYDEMMKYADKDDYEETAYNILKNHLFEKGKKLVLFFDNFGEILEKFNEKEAHRLREILMGETLIRIVGASSMMLESFYDYSKPFFEFFKIINLKGLTKKEALEFLKKIAENYGKPEVIKMIEEHPERVETLRILTEGVPRTMILLFEIFADNDNGNSFKDLELVLDRVTPLYKHRMDDLSGINQELVDIIARNWDGIEVSTIAERSKMDSKSISSQLNLLYKNNLISKISTNTKNNLYILKERFFNIWYLMRYGRKKDENRVRWLTRFLEAWFSVNRKEEKCEVCENNTEYGAVAAIINKLKLNKIEEGVIAAREFLSNEEAYEKYSNKVTLLLIFMMAKNQYNSVLKIFNENK
ncbi:MAG TPA: ATPase, partial [bacterium]|nr:ATPase [bacterium]